MSEKIVVLQPGFLKNFKPKRIKILSLDITRAGFLTLAVMSMVVIPLLKPSKASAATSTAPTRCADTNWLLDDDWVTASAKHYVTIDPGSIHALLDVLWPHHASQLSQFSMVIGRPVSPSDNHNLSVYVIDNSSSDHWQLTKDSTGYYVADTSTSSNAWSFATVGDFNWNSTTNSLNSGATKSWPFMTTGSPFIFSPGTSPKLSLSCITTVVNVTYANGWDGPAFSTKLLYGTSTIQCDKLDIGCWVSNAWTGVADTFSSVGQALLSGIANLFAPDGQKMQDDFNSFNSFMTAKLGFLSYPFTFIGSLFSAFSPDTSWCTATSCTKTFGNLFGHPFILDLNAAAETMPTLWSWFLGLVRGTTVVILVLAIRRKYMGVVGK